MLIVQEQAHKNDLPISSCTNGWLHELDSGQTSIAQLPQAWAWYWFHVISDYNKTSIAWHIEFISRAYFWLLSKMLKINWS